MSRNGLTLIEVVVALALGVVLVSGVQTLTVRAHHAAHDLRERETDLRRREGAFELIRADLLSMPLAGNLALRDGELHITTLNDLCPDSTRTRRRVSVRYRSIRDKDTSLLERTQLTPGEEDWPPGAVIARGMHTVTFEVQDGRSWTAVWPPAAMSRTATAVRISFEYDGNEHLAQTIPIAPLRWTRHD